MHSKSGVARISKRIRQQTSHQQRIELPRSISRLKNMILATVSFERM
jgi:hypothetical protein